MAMPWQAVLVTAGIGLVFLFGAGYRLAQERSLRRGGERTHGTVVDQDTRYQVTGGGISARNRSSDPGRPTRRPWAVSTTGRKGLVNAPIVEFTTTDGRTVRARSRVSSSASAVAPGRVVTLYYDPADPQEVAIVGYGRGILRAFLLIGAVVTAVAVLLLVVDEQTLESAVPVVVPTLLGSVFLAVGGIAIGRVWALRARGVQTDGTVVGETTSNTREGLTLRHPVVRFTLPTGHDVEAPAERGTFRQRARPGERVRLRYHPQDPYRMLLVGDGTRPLFWIFAVVGLVVLGGTVTIATMVYAG